MSLGKLERLCRAVVLLQSLATTMRSPMPAERTLIVQAYEEVMSILICECRPYVRALGRHMLTGAYFHRAVSPALVSWVESERAAASVQPQPESS